MCYTVLSQFSLRYSVPRGRLLTRYSPVRHVSALLHHVRLACVRHAASVCPEPGSNSLIIYSLSATLRNSLIRAQSALYYFIVRAPSAWRSLPLRRVSKKFKGILFRHVSMTLCFISCLIFKDQCAGTLKYYYSDFPVNKITKLHAKHSIGLYSALFQNLNSRPLYIRLAFTVQRSSMTFAQSLILPALHLVVNTFFYYSTQLLTPTQRFVY